MSKPESSASPAQRKPRVLIVGAGPAGSACALELRRRDAAEVVVVDRATYPRRKVCGSGLSPLSLIQLDELEMLEALRPLHIDMAGLRAVGPGGKEILLRGSKGAWVVPRTELDHRLISAAVAHGATLHEDTRVKEMLFANDGTVRGVRTTQGAFEADLVVLATGSPSTFEIDEHPREGIRTIMGWWKGRLPDNLGQMIWDERLGGYYAWAFPEPGDVVNVGLTIPEDFSDAHHLRDLFDQLLADHFSAVTEGGEQIGKWAGHPATVTARIGPVVTTRSIFVGEAARLVCPATVEGISFAMHSGRIAAKVIARSLKPDTGLSLAAQQRYKFELSVHLLPKFLVGESVYRVMRSPALRENLASVIDPQRIGSVLSSLLGEMPDSAPARPGT